MVGRPPGDRSIDQVELHRSSTQQLGEPLGGAAAPTGGALESRAAFLRSDLEKPAALLRSALEKIVYFECRVAQLEAELGAARQVAERARGDAAEARTRETGAVQALAAEREARAALALSEAEATERVRLLEAERERLLSGLVERARLGGAPSVDGTPGPEEGGADLASFIAELRAELETLRQWKAAHQAGRSVPVPAPASRAPAAPSATVDALAGGFSAGGRTGLSQVDAAQLKAYLVSHADRVLWERAMGDLSAPAATTRLRAIRQLEALGAGAAAPLLAAALGREADGGVKVELLRALARFAEPFAAGLAAAELADARPEVRAEALQALAAVAEQEAAPHLLRGLGDRSPLVRRRAAVLLGTARGEQVEAALVAALRDGDAGVARAAAAALGGRGGEATARAQAAARLRTASTGSAARRIATRLMGAEEGTVVDPVTRPAVAATASTSAARATPMPMAMPVALPMQVPTAAPPPATARSAAPLAPPVALTRTSRAPLRPSASTPAPQAGRVGPRAAVAVLEAAPSGALAPTVQAGAALEEAIRLEVRGALRGVGAEELARITGAPPARVEAALAVLAARGMVTLRNTRWWIG
jgi:hypothetical protein